MRCSGLAGLRPAAPQPPRQQLASVARPCAERDTRKLLLAGGRRRRRPAPPLVPKASAVAAAAAAGDAGSGQGSQQLADTPQQQQQQQRRGPVAAWQQWWRIDDATSSGEAGGMPAGPPQSMRDILRKVGALLAPDRLLLCSAVVFMLAAAAAELAIPHFVTTAVFAAAKVRARARAGESRAWHACACALLLQHLRLWLPGAGVWFEGQQETARRCRSVGTGAAAYAAVTPTPDRRLLAVTTPASQERSEAAFRHNLAGLGVATAAYAGCAAIRGWLFSLVNTNLLQRLRWATARRGGRGGPARRLPGWLVGGAAAVVQAGSRRGGCLCAAGDIPALAHSLPCLPPLHALQEPAVLEAHLPARLVFRLHRDGAADQPPGRRLLCHLPPLCHQHQRRAAQLAAGTWGGVGAASWGAGPVRDAPRTLAAEARVHSPVGWGGHAAPLLGARMPPLFAGCAAAAVSPARPEKLPPRTFSPPGRVCR